MQPPFIVSKCHDLWHEPSFVKREVAETLVRFKEAATSTKKGKKTRTFIKDIIKDKSDDVLLELPYACALRQRANRARKEIKKRQKSLNILRI